MAITQTQRLARTRGIGASDVPALFGRDPYMTRADLRLIKLGLVRPEPERPMGRWGTDDVGLLGTVKETALADIVSRCMRVRVVKPTGTYRRGVLFANVDRHIGKAERGRPILELKDTVDDAGYGQPGTNQVPAHVLLQTCAQMLCADSGEAFVARERHGWKRGVDIYRIVREGPITEIIDAIEAMAQAFWDRHVVAAEPLPMDEAPPTVDVLRRLPLDAAAPPAVLDPAAVAAWRDWSALAKEIEGHADEAKRRVLADLGTAASGHAAGVGKITVTMTAPKPVCCPSCGAQVSAREPWRILNFKGA